MIYFVSYLIFLILVVWFYKFTIIRINGDSMLPTLKPGRFYIVDRKFQGFEKNKIYVLTSPRGIPVEKK